MLWDISINGKVKTSGVNAANDGAVGEIGFVLVWLVGLGGRGLHNPPIYVI